ncbi:MAG: hypothetical protein IRY99_26230, partial [Isosphaeraceae bacterium]|nr:hypothetical protein [Isosphaeraceae bacterium]
MMPMLWAQAPAATDRLTVPLLALRRWYTSLTLSSPDPVPNRAGLWTWLAGLGALLLLAMIAQGPARALRQLFDLVGHARLASAALGRLRRAGRLVAVLLGVTVLAWTGSQFASYNKEERRDDLLALLKTKSLRELSMEQGVLAGLTPLRDLCGLGDNLLLLVGATVLVFRLSAGRWGGDLRPFSTEAPVPTSATLCWGSAWLYAMYRFAAMVIDPDGLPLGGCFVIEAGIIPLFMALADGLLLAWVLAELRAAGPEGFGCESIDVAGAVVRVPAATLACVAALPARYVATGVWLLLYDVPSLANLAWLRGCVRGWGLVKLQGVALVTAGLAGAAAWGRGTIGEAIRGYGRLLRAEGGRLV